MNVFWCWCKMQGTRLLISRLTPKHEAASSPAKRRLILLLTTTTPTANVCNADLTVRRFPSVAFTGTNARVAAWMKHHTHAIRPCICRWQRSKSQPRCCSRWKQWLGAGLLHQSSHRLVSRCGIGQQSAMSFIHSYHPSPIERYS